MKDINDLFPSFSPLSKVWIFQASRSLNLAEKDHLLTAGRAFTAAWKAHGADLSADCDIYEDRFYIFASDESVNAAGGCSIDKLIHFVKASGDHLQLDFFDRMSIAIISDGRIMTMPLHSLKKLIMEENIDESTIMFDNSIANLKDLQSRWKTPLNQSFLKNLMKSVTNQ